MSGFPLVPSAALTSASSTDRSGDARRIVSYNEEVEQHTHGVDVGADCRRATFEKP